MVPALEVTSSEMLSRKKALETKLRALLDAPSRREEVQIEYLADPIDQMKSDLDRETAINQLDLHARLLHEIQAAIDAIQEGTYGRCECCQEPIPANRLDAVPWARRCLRCQTDAESSSPSHPSIGDAA